MKLFLSGGGSGEQSIEVDKQFLEVIDKTKPILYIPIAINKIKHPYPGCLDWIKSNLIKLGFDDFIMWTEEDLKNKTEADFAQFSGIYIGGGNTFKLLKELKEFGTFEILKSLALKDIPIYGGSAGAIILAKTIIPAIAADPNDVGINDFSALNLMHEYNIWCHYDLSMDYEILEYMKKYNLSKIIAIPEDAGLFVNEKIIKTIGPNVTSLFNREKSIIQPGTIL